MLSATPVDTERWISPGTGWEKEGEDEVEESPTPYTERKAFLSGTSRVVGATKGTGDN